MIKFTIDETEVKYTRTFFPDGTSQVWKFDKSLKGAEFADITWVWENTESEIIEVMQLIDAVRLDNSTRCEITLYCPYLPFARQDKDSSTESFALHTFADMINAKNLAEVSTYDVHSKKAYDLIKNLRSYKPSQFHQFVRNQFKPEVIFYPDSGAYMRYVKQFNELAVYGYKVRNLESGRIEKYQVKNDFNVHIEGKRILIVDDICDGGATFEMAAVALKEKGVGEIGLCVSHGLFSKGFNGMKKAGIDQFFYTNSLLKCIDGFKIWE